MRHTISVLVENEFGVLSRVAGLFSGRGFNIESLCVAETLDPTVSRMTIVTSGNEQIMEQILKQLNKLVCVIKVVDMTRSDYVERELVLIKVTADEKTKPEILRLVDIFRGKIVDVSAESYTIEVTGDEGKINAIIELMRPLGIREIARTGKIAMTRGPRTLKEAKKIKQGVENGDLLRQGL
ncbi:MAG: acetolactate synthase small subunit [Deltaproteobacteria bacterium]|nr:MAG: acetolactate synthase small subunit [Deltaproteobacteria bacterium]